MEEDLHENTVEVRNAKTLLSDHIKVKDFSTPIFELNMN
jgi:hypothetical protein